MKTRLLTLVAFVACATTCYVPAIADGGGVTTIAVGRCTGAGPVAGPWDIYEDMFAADAPTWLPTHTHQGIECTLGAKGTTMWWFAGAGKVPVPVGRAVLTAQGRVHTAGDDGPAPMAYFAVHVLVAGAPYRTLVPDASAPPVVSTHGASRFHNIFPAQPGYAGTFVVNMRLRGIAARGGFDLGRQPGIGYHTVVSGTLTVTLGGATRTYGPGAAFSVPARVPVGIRNLGIGPAVLASARVVAAGAQ